VHPPQDPFATADTSLNLPLSAEFGGVVDVVEVLSAIGFVRGTHPFSFTARASGSLDLAQVRGVEQASVLRVEQQVGANTTWSACVDGGSWRACVQVGLAKVSLRVYATEESVGRDALRRLVGLVTPPQEPPEAHQVPISFHFLGDRGVSSERRIIDAPAWEDISCNYPSGARGPLGSLVALGGGPAVGRLVLLHGPPGTGKTTAIRSLVRAWRPWCDASYVMDPEVLFSKTSYLHQLVLSGPEHSWELDDDEEPGGEDAKRWRLLVVEDADEIIAADARDRAGQALSRLLNLTDGLLGQGLRTLVMITTNEPISSLHPALTRPGRCLAEIEIPRFDAAGAREWLAAKPEVTVPPGGATLAELFELRDGAPGERRTSGADTSTGMYL